MSEAKKINTGVVASLSDTDLLLASDSGGTLRPISLANIKKLLRDDLRIGGRNLIKNSGGTIQSTFAYSSMNMSVPITTKDIGEQFTLSFRYEYSDATTGSAGSSRRFYLYMVFGTSELGCNLLLPQNSAGLSGKGHASATITIPSFTGDPVSIVRAVIQITSGTVRMCNFKLERGNVATDWSPAPEDLGWGGGKSKIHNQLRFTISRRAERRSA